MTRVNPMKSTRAYKANDGTLFEDMDECIEHNAQQRFNTLMEYYNRNPISVIKMLEFNKGDPKFMATLEKASVLYQAYLDE